MKQFTIIAMVAVAVTWWSPAGSSAATQDDEFVMLYFPHADYVSDFSNTWGDARPGGRRHRGTDVMTAKHTPVVAVADGFVERIREGGRSGWYVMLRHAGGWTSYYMHLNDDTPGTDDGRGGREYAVPVDLEVGDYVAAGDLIGWVGDSGNAEFSGAHTHFELHHDGRAVNPYRYLKAAWDRKLRRAELAGLVR